MSPSENCQFEHDVFVSYATANNGDGWVSSFVTNLKTHLDAELKRSPTQRIWWDETSINPEARLTEQIRAKVTRSRFLVVILSKAYVRSDWCRQEREAFLQAYPDAIREERVVLIDIGSLPLENWPREFHDIRGRRFYTEPASGNSQHPQPIGFPTPKKDNDDHHPFFSRVRDLAIDLARKLEVGVGSRIASLRAPHHPKVKIFVAEASDDISDHRDDVASYLADHFTVFPSLDQSLPTNWDEWRSKVDEGLCEADFYVQLVGDHPGGKIRGSQERPVTAQFEMARDSKRPMLLWRKGNRPTDDQSPLATLFEAAEYCGSIPDFCKEVVKRATPVAAPEKPLPAGDPSSHYNNVFIHLDKVDEEQARGLIKQLGELKCRVSAALLEGSPHEIRRHLISNVSRSQGLVLLYGQINSGRLQIRFDEICKVIEARRRKSGDLTVPRILVYKGEPHPKSDPLFSFPDMQFLEANLGNVTERLQQWISNLPTGGVS